MKYIEATDLVFDVKQLAYEYSVISNHVAAAQINLRKKSGMSDIEGLTHRAGSLYENNIAVDNDRYWNTYITSLGISYTIETLKEIESWVQTAYSAKVGRARYMALKPKSCLTYHKDNDNILRVHIPIHTNDNCFFVNEDIVGRMQVPGRAYIFNNQVKHTAVNASRENRVHIVVNCYK